MIATPSVTACVREFRNSSALSLKYCVFGIFVLLKGCSYIFIVMRIGQLVKLKPYTEIQFSDPEHGAISYINECLECDCILLSFCTERRTCEVLLDGAVGFNVDPADLEVV